MLRIFRTGVITGVLITVCVAGASFSLAQEFRGSILGLVSDPSGGPVPGATVTVVMQSTNQTYTTKSDGVGVYSINFINPGQFTVTVEAGGFEKTVYPNVTIKAGQKLNLNVTLVVGAVRQEVTVSAAPGLLDTSGASTGGEIDQNRIELMVSLDRDSWNDVIFLQGVSYKANVGINLITGTNTGVRYIVNGAPPTDAWFLNGAPVSLNTGNWLFSASQDAIQEIQANIGSYDTQYGPSPGAAFTQIIKQGTDRYHGDVYDYYETEALEPTSYSNDLLGLNRNFRQMNIYGGTLGGPIQKDKTFFFAAYEGNHTVAATPIIASVPTAAEKQGNFAGSGYTIYDPLTVTCTKTSSSGCSTYGRTAFSSNAIPASRINTSGAAIMNLYPLPNISSVTGLSDYAINFGRLAGYNQYIGRLDHDFSNSTRLSTVFTRTKGTTFTNQNGLTGLGQNNTWGYVPNDINGIVDVTHAFSPGLVADFKASITRYTTMTMSGEAITQNYKIPGLTMPVVPNSPYPGIAPTISVANYASLIGDTFTGSNYNYWFLCPSVAQLKGRHSLHYGFEYIGIQTGALGTPGTPNGTFGFTGVWTRSNPLGSTTGAGNALADLLLGEPATGNIVWGINNFISNSYDALYAQDDIKVSKSLTVNAGLRWDVDPSPFERHNRINAGFCFTCPNPLTSQINYTTYPTLQNPLTGGLLFAGVSAPRAPARVRLNNWQPRIGFAWAINPKTVFRGGFGIFYSYENTPWLTIGFSQATSYINSLDGGLHDSLYFASGVPFPSGIIAPVNASQGLATAAGNAVSFDSPAGVSAVPWTSHWSAGFQRELPEHILLDVTYQGSHSHGIYVSQPWGVISSAQQAACFADHTICDTLVSNPFYGVVPASTSLGASKTVTAVTLMRQDPLFFGVQENNDPIGYQKYNALQARFQRQIKGLNFIVNYTYSATMNAIAYLNAGTWRDANLWYGLNSADSRHYTNSNVAWHVPMGQGGKLLPNAHGFLSVLLSNWVVDASHMWYTGLPLPLPSANLNGSPGCTSYYPVGGQTQQHWFNNDESCYVQLTTYQARTRAPLYIGYLRDPKYWGINTSLQKRFALPREGTSLVFRCDTTNFTNHPTFGAPNTTVSALPTFTPNVGWSGFGALPTTQNNYNRTVLLSLKIIF